MQMPRPKPALLIDTHVPEEPWDKDAACRSSGLTHLFFTDDDESIVEAKKVCQGCLVRVACLAHAIALRDPEGIWGGLTGAERKALLRRRSLLKKYRAA
jgi:WhiB family transcriptional regulator, redox-sensing transcriptional regulator